MKLPLNLAYLKYFCDAIKRNSISASARKNYVSQSAISQAIAKLEDALGKRLYTHHYKKLKLTEEGQLVFEKGQQIFRCISELEEALAFQEGEYSGQIEIACTHSFALAQLPRYLKKLKAKHPQIQLNFRLGHTNLIRDWLKKGVIDFGIVLDNEDLSGFDCYEIHKGEYRLYSATTARQEDMTEMPVILSEERPETNRLKDNYRKRFDRPLPVLMEVSSWEVIANLVKEGLGMGFIPDYVTDRRQKKVRAVDLGLDPIPYRVYAIFPKNSTLSKKALAAIELFQTL